MADPWNQNPSGGGQPHRRVLKGRVVTDAQGNRIFRPVSGEAHGISPEDSLDTIESEFDQFLDCGCSAKPNQPRFHCCEPGCPHVVCDQHVRYCQVCMKGLCSQCQHFLMVTPSQRVDLCPTHYHEVRRKQFWQNLARTALRPFVDFNVEDKSK